MLKEMLDGIGSLTLAEKMALEEAARDAVARELGAQGAPAPEACPRCGCPEFVRKGRGRDGSQRWLCRGCGQTFCAKTMGLLANSTRSRCGCWTSPRSAAPRPPRTESRPPPTSASSPPA